MHSKLSLATTLIDEVAESSDCTERIGGDLEMMNNAIDHLYAAKDLLVRSSYSASDISKAIQDIKSAAVRIERLSK